MVWYLQTLNKNVKCRQCNGSGNERAYLIRMEVGLALFFAIMIFCLGWILGNVTA